MKGPLVVALIVCIIPVSYSVFQPYFEGHPARVYWVQLESNVAAIGADSVITANISYVGNAYITTLQKDRLQSKPPLATFLRIISGGTTTYVAVIWVTGSDGNPHATFQKLMVPVTNPQDMASFYYQGFIGGEKWFGMF